ncbi:MAG: hypothetical protein EBS42_04275 [Caulobacteraceae bacterium]|nr:hypothetical protein [Caulobacteraceae bacterium]
MLHEAPRGHDKAALQVPAKREFLDQEAGHDGFAGAWIVGDEPAGMGLREDRGRVTRDLSRYLPHAIVG